MGSSLRGNLRKKIIRGAQIFKLLSKRSFERKYKMRITNSGVRLPESALYAMGGLLVVEKNRRTSQKEARNYRCRQCQLTSFGIRPVM